MLFHELKIGDKVSYRGSFGQGPITQAVVIGMDRNGKNGRETVDLDNHHWAYLDQIEDIVAS